MHPYFPILSESACWQLASWGLFIVAGVAELLALSLGAILIHESPQALMTQLRPGDEAAVGAKVSAFLAFALASAPPMWAFHRALLISCTAPLAVVIFGIACLDFVYRDVWDNLRSVTLAAAMFWRIFVEAVPVARQDLQFWYYDASPWWRGLLEIYPHCAMGLAVAHLVVMALAHVAPQRSRSPAVRGFLGATCIFAATLYIGSSAAVPSSRMSSVSGMPSLLLS